MLSANRCVSRRLKIPPLLENMFPRPTQQHQKVNSWNFYPLCETQSWLCLTEHLKGMRRHQTDPRTPKVSNFWPNMVQISELVFWMCSTTVLNDLKMNNDVVEKEWPREAFPLKRLQLRETLNLQLLSRSCLVATSKRLPGVNVGKCINKSQCTAVNYGLLKFFLDE